MLLSCASFRAGLCFCSPSKSFPVMCDTYDYKGILMKSINKITLCCLIAFSIFIKPHGEEDEEQQSFCRRLCTVGAFACMIITAAQGSLLLTSQLPPTPLRSLEPNNSRSLSNGIGRLKKNN